MGACFWGDAFRELGVDAGGGWGVRVEGEGWVGVIGMIFSGCVVEDGRGVDRLRLECRGHSGLRAEI